MRNVEQHIKSYVNGVCLIIAIFSYSNQAGAQNFPQKYLVNQISFQGNYRTQDSRIMREMSIRVGDSLTMIEITDRLRRSKEKIINTGLFTDVTTNLYFDEENFRNVRVFITVKEGLYFVPIPIIELADRNFNVWWTEHKRSFKYVNWGLYLKLRNMTGNADGISLLGQWGYDQKFILHYESPYFDANRKWRFELDLYNASNKELIVNTDLGKPIYLRNDDEFQLSRYEYEMSFLYRPLLNSFYMVTFGYHQNSISEAVFDANPGFLNHSTKQRFSKIKMEYSYENRNNKYLATDGWYFRSALIKNGLMKSDDLKSTEFEGDFFYHQKLNTYWTWSNSLQLRLRFWDKPFPYFNMYRLGGEKEYIRGYEYYHIEGNNLGILKTGVTRKIFDRSLAWGNVMPFKNYRDMDTKLFLSFNVDYGYIKENRFKTSPFVNKNIFGGGIGLNLLIYHQFSCSFEFSMNQRKETGLFFHLNQNF